MNRETVRQYSTIAISLFEREEARREGVERQALTLLGVTGLISSLWMGLGQTLLTYSQKQYHLATITMSCIFCVILLAFLGTLIFALLALRRIPIHMLFPEEVEPFDYESEEAYLERMSRLRIDLMNKNASKTNWKVRHLKRARWCFFTGIAAILAGGATNITFAISNLVRPWM